MSNVKIKEDFDHKTLEDMGYTYSIMEGGYISKDDATIVSINRTPYQRQVMQLRPNVEKEHQINIDKLKEINAIEQ